MIPALDSGMRGKELQSSWTWRMGNAMSASGYVQSNAVESFDTKVLVRAFVFSIVLHLALFLVWVLWIKTSKVENSVSRTVQIEMVSPEELNQKEMVVRRTAVSANQEIPKDDFHLGEKNQKVREQTTADVTQALSGKSATKKSVGKISATSENIPKLNQLGIPIYKEMKKKGESGDFQDNADYYAGEQLSQDYVKGLKRGEKTLLNTREFVFFGYFERIRGRLDRAWSSSLRENLERFFRQGRRLASDLDYVTKTLVTLNQTGEIVRVQVLAESGANDLDSAAVKAFNLAGPFPNPPKGIIDQDGIVRIRWDFVLKN